MSQGQPSIQLRRQPVTVGRLVLCLLAFGAVWAAQGCGDGTENPAPTTAAAATTAILPELIRSDSPVIGPADAPVTLVEFLDPECEACRAAYPGVEKLLAEYPEEVRLVVRYFPLHGNSVLAAIATEAAGEQGKYKEMQKLLFERQSEWGEQQAPQSERFTQYAAELGLDTDRFASAMAKPEYAAKVARDKADGLTVGVTGTPAFFVNGRYIPRSSPAALRAAIEAALDP